MTGELHSTPSGSNPVLDLFYIRPPSASTYYDENPISWVMHGVFGVYSTNSFSLLSRLCLYYNRYSVVCQGAKGKFFEYYQEHLVRRNRTFTILLDYTKPPGPDKSFSKGDRTLSLYSFKTNPSKTLLNSLLYVQYNRYSAICQWGNQSLFSYFYLCVISATHNIPNITGFGADVKSLFINFGIYFANVWNLSR